MNEPERISEQIHDTAIRIHNRIVFIRQVRGTVQLLDARQSVRKGISTTPEIEKEIKLDTLDSLSTTVLDDIDNLCTYVHLMYTLTENEDENNGSQDSEQGPSA